MKELKKLRIQLTAWYVGVFSLILLVFGTALFSVLTHQISRRLDLSLSRATDRLALASLVGEQEEQSGSGRPNALDELDIPGRTLYLFDGSGALIRPDTAGVWIRDLAAEAKRQGRIVREHEFPNEVSWRALARSFTLPGGEDYVAVVSADVVELDDEYAGLLFAFALAALVALAAVGLGGWFVSRRSTEPIRDSFQRTRDFMADAAHELRTPVAVVEGHAEVALRQPRDADEYVEVLGTIHAEAVRLGGILENLLTIARADAQSWPVHFEPLFLDDLLLDVIENVQVVAENKTVTLEVAALDELPVQGDPELLRQLIIILLDNAVKFSPVGERVVITARRDDGRAVVDVEDHGPGIDPEVLPHVFERFYRGDKARGRESGAGLGLSIGRWIAGIHSATISIDSECGMGTRVSVSIPLEEESR